MIDLRAWVDRVASVYAAGDWADEARRARQEFRELTGRLLEEEEGSDALERALHAFLEWYVLERSLAGGPTPLLRYAHERREEVGEEGRAALAALASAHRSLFELIALDGERVELRDVLLGGAWEVHERRAMPGASVGDLFEARLVPLAGGMAFFGTHTFHPREAREAILAHCTAAIYQGKRRGDVLWELERKRVKSLRYRHLPSPRIYAEQ
ncbi:MAG: hypothetical protein AABZ30_06565 [Myxococcota bacterium]